MDHVVAWMGYPKIWFPKIERWYCTALSRFGLAGRMEKTRSRIPAKRELRSSGTGSAMYMYLQWLGKRWVEIEVSCQRFDRE